MHKTQAAGRHHLMRQCCQIYKSMEIYDKMEDKDAPLTIKQPGKDIISLCSACISLCRKNEMVVTVQMCACFAYLVSCTLLNCQMVHW
jgi:hypothetical protein